MTCGYIYDPVEGEPAYGVPPATDFDLIEDLVCPECDASKANFVPLPKIHLNAE